jgi:putative transposase
MRGAQLTPLSAYDLRRAWNRAKHQVAPWWAENSKEAYSSGLANAATAFKNYGDSWNGKRRGPKIRPPRFKGRRARLSCRFTAGAFGLTPDRRHVKLPRIGAVRTCESTRKLARKLEAGTARILSATLSHQRGRWHVSLSVELPEPQPAPRTTDRVAGVDLGIKSLAVLSTGEVVPNPRHLERVLGALRRAQRRVSRRRGPDRRTRREPSHRWCKAMARVAALHTRVANQRRDGLHQLSTRLVRAHDTIVVEDLHVAGMVRNKRLARHISGLVERRLKYMPNAELFDRIADGYDEDVPFYASLGRLPVSWAEPAADARVLDIGAGRGAITKALVEARGSAGEVVAGDISPKMLEQLSVR